MNSSTLRNLGIVLFALVAILIGLELADDSAEVSATGQPLFEDLRERINDVEQLAIDRPDAEQLVITKGDEGWVVENRNGYPADVAKVREILLALADADVLEEKTSNPERYAAIGVADPEAGDGAGIRLTASGEAFEYAVIIGNENPGSGRYVRPAGEATSLLIDTNPAPPDDASGWLMRDLVDIETANVASVSITHADGETIRIEKAAAEDADFAVPGVPDGRELSYPTVANGIAGALNNLELEDVRRSFAAEPIATTVFTTFDGLEVRVTSYGADDDANWIGIDAEAAGAASTGEAGDETESAAPDDLQERVEAIDSRTRERHFRIPGFKANLLKRRWEDILKAEAGAEED